MIIKTEVEIEETSNLLSDLISNMGGAEIAKGTLNSGLMYANELVPNLDCVGRETVMALYKKVCKWYESHPEEAEEEGYTEL